MNIPSPHSVKTDIDVDEIVFEHLSKDRSRAAVRGAFWSALTSIVPVILNGLVFIVTSRFLLPKDFGIIAIAISVVSFATAISPTAFGQALIQQQTIRRSHVDTVFWMSVASAAFLYAIIVVAAPFIAHIVHQDAITYMLLIIGLKLFFDMAAIVPNALISRTMSFHLAAVRTIIATIISAALCLVLILIGFGIWALVIAQIAGSVAACAASFWGARWWPGMSIKRESFLELARYGLFASGNSFMQNMNLDQLIIGGFVGPASLGIYNFARRLFQMLNDVVTGGLTSVSHALLSSLQQDEAKVREAFLMATFGCSLFAYPMFMGLAAVADDVIPLVFGSQWFPAIWPVRFFCVIGLTSGIGVIQSSLINSQGKSDWWFYYQLARNIITLLIIVLLKDQGISAITLAIMIQVLLLWPVTLWMVSRLISLSIGKYFGQFVGPTLSYVGMLCAVLSVGWMMRGNSPLFRLAIEIFIGAIVYCGLIVLLCRDRIFAIFKIISSTRRKSVQEIA